MSLVVFVAVAFGFAGLGLAFRTRPHITTMVGIVGLSAAVLAAVAIVPDQIVRIGTGGLATTAYLRLFLVLGTLIALGLSIAGLAAGSRRDAPGVMLAILGAAGLTLALTDPRDAVLVATAGGLFGVLVTLVPSGGRAGATVGIRETRAVVVSGTLAVAATAWIGRDLSQLAAQPAVFGLAYVAFVVAVAIRFGAIPFHLWAARLTDVVPETALPILTIIAPASLAVVALAWMDSSVAPLLLDLRPERAIILAIAVASIVLAAIACFVQDDLEHIVGYSIVGDAGVVMLALAALDPASWQPARIWILVFVVTRSAFAAWAAGIRAQFWTGRVPDLRGWARRSPILALAFVPIVVAGVGLPGLVSFDARTSLIGLSLDGPFAVVVFAGTIAPVGYYGRLLYVGLQHPDRLGVAGGTWMPRFTPVDLTALGPWLRTTADANRAVTTAAIALLLGMLALGTAAGWFGGPVSAAGLPPSLEAPTEFFVPQE